MSGPHLGDRVTPLVDERLAPDAALRAHEHARSCCTCAGEVDAERLVKARLASLSTPEVSHDLLVRLLDIGGPAGPLPPRDALIAQPARPATTLAPPGRRDATGPRAGRPDGRARRVRRRRRPVAAALAGTFTLLGAGIVGVLVLGGSPGGAPAPVAELRTTPSSAPTLDPVTPAATPTPSTASPLPAPAR